MRRAPTQRLSPWRVDLTSFLQSMAPPLEFDRSVHIPCSSSVPFVWTRMCVLRDGHQARLPAATGSRALFWGEEHASVPPLPLHQQIHRATVQSPRLQRSRRRMPESKRRAAPQLHPDRIALLNEHKKLRIPPPPPTHHIHQKV